MLSRSPDARLSQLHGRASRWCEAPGLLEEAVQYVLEAQDRQRVVRLVEQEGTPYVLNRHIETGLAWLNELRDAVLRATGALPAAVNGPDAGSRRTSALHRGRAWALAQARPPLIDAQLWSMWLTLARFKGYLPGSVLLTKQALLGIGVYTPYVTNRSNTWLP